jgi:hypothetical protein
LGGLDVELIYVIFGVGFIVTTAFVGFELLEGFWSLKTWDGTDEEWMAPLAVFSLLAFMAGLSYFG